MRDPQRIYKINSLINAIWLTCPDMRYFQLMDSIRAEHNKQLGIKSDSDVFNVEDHALEATLQIILEKGFTR
jgi:hypothetical protein